MDPNPETGNGDTPGAQVAHLITQKLLLATLIAPAQTRTVLTGLLPARDKSGEYWECGNGCGQTRLRPLRAPAG